MAYLRALLIAFKSSICNYGVSSICLIGLLNVELMRKDGVIISWPARLPILVGGHYSCFAVGVLTPLAYKARCNIIIVKIQATSITL